MQFPLIAAVTLTFLGFAWGKASESDKPQFFDSLKDDEEDQGILIESLRNKALAVEENVIQKLGKNSSFEVFIKENSTLQIVSNQKVDFILKFSCAYNNKIFANELYKSSPDFRQIYNIYRSESNKDIAEFDKLLFQDASRMLNKIQKTSMTLCKLIWFARE